MGDTAAEQDNQSMDDYSSTSCLTALGEENIGEGGGGGGVAGNGAGRLVKAEEASEVDYEHELDSGVTLTEGAGGCILGSTPLSGETSQDSEKTWQRLGPFSSPPTSTEIDLKSIDENPSSSDSSHVVPSRALHHYPKISSNTLGEKAAEEYFRSLPSTSATVSSQYPAQEQQLVHVTDSTLSAAKPVRFFAKFNKFQIIAIARFIRIFKMQKQASAKQQDSGKGRLTLKCNIQRIKKAQLALGQWKDSRLERIRSLRVRIPFCIRVMSCLKVQMGRLERWGKESYLQQRRKLLNIRIKRTSSGAYLPFEFVIPPESKSSEALTRNFFGLSEKHSVSSSDEDSSGSFDNDDKLKIVNVENVPSVQEENTMGLADTWSSNFSPTSFFLTSTELPKQDADVGEKRDGDTDTKTSDAESAASVSPANTDGLLRQRQHALMEHPFFLLDVRLQEGRDLVVRDTCGTSDPYVKFKVGSKQVYKSRIIYKNLNPRWDENFTIPIEDVNKPVHVKVFDYDRGMHDDPMGTAEIDLSQLELGKESDLKLLLSDRGKPEYMGFLLLTCTLLPKTQEDKEQFLQRGSIRSADIISTKKLKMQMWSGVVTIVLVEGMDLVPMDDNGLSDPYVKFKLGNEKYRSKYKPKTLSPRWLEQFDLRMYTDQSQQLEIAVYDYDSRGRDDFMGRATIDLSSMETELTHHLDVELEDGAGLLKVLLTISGTCTTDATSDLCNFTPSARHQGQLQRKYSFLKLSDFSDVGHLQVKVFKACGLKSADIGGNSDPFCVLELVNARVQTHTEYKTLNPEWNKVFSFKVRDIHSLLEVTVFDEDRDKKVEFLGKVAIPLLKIRSGERRWYALKDKKLRARTKGSILLELDLIFNHVKAALRTVNPLEEKFMQVEPKFKIQLMKKNIDRVGQLISTFVELGKFLQSCFNWESTPRSATAFVVFLVMVWNFEIYMLPMTLLLIFLKNLLISQAMGAFKRDQVDDDYQPEDEEEEDEEKERFNSIFKTVNMLATEEKKSIKEKLLSIQDVCLQVQQGMDMVASLGERIKNTFNWTVPWLSALAMVALTALVFVLYFIPLRWLILAWGMNKFTKKLRKPNAINNNELLDFLSRVPSDSELAQYREFRPELSPALGKKKRL